jgi:hypothetical protein
VSRKPMSSTVDEAGRLRSGDRRLPEVGRSGVEGWKMLSGGKRDEGGFEGVVTETYGFCGLERRRVEEGKSLKGGFVFEVSMAVVL